MLEDKKLLFISSRQRVGITGLLTGMLLATGLAVYGTATHPAYSSLVEPLVDVFMLLLTGFAAWGLIVLYASANSAERIAKETDRFFREDVLAAFERNGFRQTKLARGTEVSLLRNQAGAAVYAISLNGYPAVLVWCRLNVNQLSTVFLLRPELAAGYETVFQATLKGFKGEAVHVEAFGVQRHDIDGVLPEPDEFFELYTRRVLPGDFLFDAASRYATASSLFGDARSFLVETMRRKKDLLQAPLAQTFAGAAHGGADSPAAVKDAGVPRPEPPRAASSEP